jgi:hypothetical protein
MRLGSGLGLSKPSGTALTYIKDGLKLYMPYKGADTTKGTQFVGTGSTSFDGVNDYVNCGVTGIPTGNTARTMMIWVYQGTALGADRGIFGCGETGGSETRETFEFYNYNGGITVHYAGGNSGAVTTLGQNVWRHIAATHDGSTVSVYIDGVLDHTDTGETLDTKADFCRIGANNYGASPGEFFQGSLKNAAIWNRALTATEVQNVMYKSYVNVSGRLASGLVSWWGLDVDYTDSKGSNDGTNSGSTLNTDLYGGDTPVIPRGIDNARTVQADAIGAGSASLNGSNDGDEIICGNDSSLAIVGDMSVTAWINATNVTDVAGLIVKRDTGGTNYQVDLNTARKIRVYAGGDTVTSTTAVTLGEWTHIASTVDSGATDGAKTYINGVQDATTGDVTITADDANLVLGHNEADGSNGHYGGYMSQVGIWDAILTQAQIQSVMEKTYEELTASEKTDLVSYWALDEETGTDGEAGTGGVKDSHGTNHGTLV